MAQDLFDYPRMVQTALRNVMREALARTASEGLPGGHHFFVTFRTRAAGAIMPKHLLAKYPDEMTIVLEHQYWDLDVTEEALSVTLSFNNKPERLVVPFGAVTAFADPSVKFGLQFQPPNEEPAPVSAANPGSDPAAAPKPGNQPGEVVALDSFRKK